MSQNPFRDIPSDAVPPGDEDNGGGSGGGGGGGGHTVPERLAALEAHLPHLATRADIADLKIYVADVKVAIENAKYRLVLASLTLAGFGGLVAGFVVVFFGPE